MADMETGRIKSLERELAESSDRAVELERKLKERGMELQNRDARLSVKEKHAKGLSDMLSRAAVLEAELAGKDALLAELRLRLAGKEGQIAEFERLSVVREGRIAALGRAATETNSMLNSCADAITKRDADIKALERELADGKEKITAIFNSASWRISAPLRLAAGFLRKR